MQDVIATHITSLNLSAHHVAHTSECTLDSKLFPLRLQLALAEVIPELHLLEQVASEEHIGSLAENLLEAMTDNDTCQAKVRGQGAVAIWDVCDRE